MSQDLELEQSGFHSFQQFSTPLGAFVCQKEPCWCLSIDFIPWLNFSEIDELAKSRARRVSKNFFQNFLDTGVN